MSGMFHVDFIDMPLWSSLAAQLGFAGPIDGRRTHAITDADALLFFDRHLLARQRDVLGVPKGQFVEVTLASHRP